MRLTAELINNSLSYLNPLKERELDLRGHKIPTIENLGVAGRQDAIDFTDNDITTLTNFPLSPSLSTLLCARNRIQSIDRKIGESLPNLTTLMLSNNNLRELADLEGLRGCSKLTHLVLSDNPITKKEHYRHYLIWSIPSLRFIDYQKVRDIERTQAASLFGTADSPTELAARVRGVKSKTFDINAAATAVNGSAKSTSGGGKGFRVILSKTEKERLQNLVNGATSFAEIDRINKELSAGRIPHGIADADRMTS